MSSEKGIMLDNYDKGLLISLINQADKCGYNFSPDELEKLLKIKKKLQKG